MKMRKSEHRYSWQRKLVKGIRRVSLAILIIWSVSPVAESNSLVLNEAAARLGQSLRETEDQLIRDMLAGTASVVNCVNGVNGDNPTELTRADVDGVVATLQGNDGDFVANVIEGQDKFGTGPVRDSYFGMCDTGMIGQLEAANGFINKAQYPNQANISPAEWGSIGNVRFFLSSRGSVTVAASLLGADVYNCFISAQDAYAKIEQNGVSAKFIYHPPGLTTKTRILVKSPLIDLEALTENAEGDRAQATERWAA